MLTEDASEIYPEEAAFDAMISDEAVVRVDSLTIADSEDDARTTDDPE